ncbi:MAG: DmsE family decaheme c-type cytochrome [Chromatiales bacterium]|nr:MAG: DmsE family decaheme c-type cytochrome [Chromatiales bacterium]
MVMPMTRRLPLFICCLLAAATGWAQSVPAPAVQGTAGSAAPDAAATAVGAPEYSKKGADTCIACHGQYAAYPVFDIFKTKHAVKADSRTPFAGLQCEACHGPGVKSPLFMAEAAEPRSHVGQIGPILNFGAKANAPAAVQNEMCLQCHKGDNRMAWHSSAHETGDVACASCHTVHAAHDPVLDKVNQTDVCFTCHQSVRAEFSKPSNHPVRFGQLGCSDCHASHGAGTSTLLLRTTLNETCYSCHAEKRGPFLFEHAPASEDCALCHAPHGSIHPALLKKRPPLLCQQCHSQVGHPSVARTTAGLPDAAPSGFLLAGSCTNCHTQVHGSNHPSGVKQMR